jgi:hemoglobin
MFAGERAELAKTHALRVARAFHGRLEALSAGVELGPAPLQIEVTQHGPGGRGVR